MKKLFTVLMAVFAIGAQGASANTSRTILTTDLHLMMATVSPFNVINWKVGDKLAYDISAGSFGKLGKMNKEVTKEEGNAVWIHQVADLGFQKDTSDILMDRATAKIIKFIHNGKEEQMPDDKIEIISQEYEEVTVPKGTFKSIHVVAKSKQIKKLDAWINPTDTAMDGTIKTIIATDMFDMVMELTDFVRN